MFHRDFQRVFMAMKLLLNSAHTVSLFMLIEAVECNVWLPHQPCIVLKLATLIARSETHHPMELILLKAPTTKLTTSNNWHAHT